MMGAMARTWSPSWQPIVLDMMPPKLMPVEKMRASSMQ